MKKIIYLFIAIFLSFQINTAYSLSDTLYIDNGGTADYTSINEAVNALKTLGVTGDVVFIIKSSSLTRYVNNEKILMGDLLFGNYSITFKGDNSLGANPIEIESSATALQNYVLSMDNCTNIHFENITFIGHKNDSEIAGTVINIDYGCENISFENCNFVADTTYDKTDARYSVVRHQNNMSTNSTNNITFNNCNISGGTFGIYWSATTMETGLTVSNCSIKNVCAEGIYLNSQKNAFIDKNIITDFQYNNYFDTLIGITLYSCGENNTICNNFINVQGYLNYCYGIFFQYTNTALGVSNLIVNNVINQGYSYNENKGISLLSSFNTNIYYNTVNLAGSNLISTNVLCDSPNSNMSIKNNIFANYASIIYDFNDLNYESSNNLFENNYSAILKVGTSSYYLNDLNANGLETNSVNKSVYFVNYNNLDFRLGTYSYAESSAIPISGIFYDIEGNPRNALTPDIGAYECNSIKPLSGTINTNTNWSGDVYVADSIVIPQGVTLTIEPNTNINIINSSSYAFFRVEGQLKANGLENLPINFIPEANSFFQGFDFTNINSLDTSVLAYCYISYIYNNAGVGGAIKTFASNLIIKGCYFYYNQGNDGGAIYTNGGNTVIDANYFESNNANNNGGAIYVTSSATPKITNNIFNSNSSNTSGGAIYIDNNLSDLYIINNTFVNNVTTYAPNGNAIGSLTDFGDIYLYNNILYNTTAESYLLYATVKKFKAFNNFISDISLSTLDIGSGYNQTGNPFIDQNFRLLNESNCIDAGYNVSTFNVPALDYFGFQRFVNNAYDIGSAEYQGVYAYAGIDQEVCGDNTTLAANEPVLETGNWEVVSGTGIVQTPSLFNSFVYNLQSGENILRWNVTNGIFSTFDDVSIFNNTPYAYAGEDQYLISDLLNDSISTTTLESNYVEYPNYGYWTVLEGTGLINLPKNLTSVINMSCGINRFLWTVNKSGLTCSSSDEVIVYVGHNMVSNGITGGNWDDPNSWNLNAIPGPGDSVTVYNTQLNIDGDASCAILYVGSGANIGLNGTTPTSTLTTGTLKIEADPVKFKGIKGSANLRIDNGTIIVNQEYDPLVPALTVGSGGNLAISSSDLITGHSSLIISNGGKVAIKQTVLNDISTANLVIGNNGSVTIQQSSQKNNKGSNDFIIGNSGKVLVKQSSAKGDVGTLTIDGGGVVIQQSAEKGEPGSLTIDGGGVVIQQSAEKSKTNDNALTIDGGGVVIQQSAEKGAVGTLTITGGGVVIQQSAEKGSVGTLTIDGGGVVIQQSAEKSKAGDEALTISGGSVVIQQSAEKGEPGSLTISGGGVVIQQSAEKGEPGSLTIEGGGVVIQQSAEKASNVNESLIINGGKLVVKQSTNILAPASTIVNVPDIKILNNGKLFIGDKTGGKTTNVSVYTRGLTVLPNTIKGLLADTSLYIYSNGGLITDQTTTGFPAREYRLGNGANVTIEDGAVLNLFNQTTPATLIMEENASLIDYNPSNYIQGKIERNFGLNEQKYFCVPLESAAVNSFSPLATIKTWNESTSSWGQLNSNSQILALQGSKINFSETTFQTLSGIFNGGNENITVTADATNPILKGINCVGNPYPSAIDFEKINLNADVNKCYYQFNPLLGTMAIYQQGGISINNARQYILSTEAFLIRTDFTTDFSIDNSAQVHFALTPLKKEKTFTDLLKLKVSNTLNSDETVIRFANDATANFENQYDAVKIFADVLLIPQLYTVSNNLPLAINCLDYPTAKTAISLKFKSSIPNNYTIDVVDWFFNTNVNVYLKDLSTGITTNLKTNNYSFNYTNINTEYNFVLTFEGLPTFDENVVNSKITVYASENQIYFDSNYTSDYKYQIFDINGKLLNQNTLHSGFSSITFDHPAGIYLIKTINENETNNFKVFIK